MIAVTNNRDFQEYVEQLLDRCECDDLEFKSASGGFPGSFWETYSAFANTDGGTIVLGVAEKKGKFYLDNLTSDQIDKYKKEFWNNVNNRNTVSCNLMKSGDVMEGEFEGSRILLFFVPRANREMRPVYRTNNPYNGTFKRNYEGDYKCTDSEVRRMFADADSGRSADSRILKNYSLDDIDAESLKRYRQLFKNHAPDHPWHVSDDMELLKKLGAYRKDRQTGEEGFTVAGLLMFGKYQSITDVECTPNFYPDYQEHLTEDENIRWTNRICADGSWEANLLNFFLKVLPRLQSVLPKPFVLEGNTRREETSAHVAVREALVNACIHSDYSVNASLVVRHNNNGFVFSNPGTLLVTKDQYYQGGESVCRNKLLQTMFSMIGVAEKAGSGTDKILKGWRDTNWKLPVLEEHTGPDKVVLNMPMESLLSDKCKQTLEQKYGILTESFDKNELSVLALACEEGCVTNERLRYSTNLHRRDITDLLGIMTRQGLLEAEGYGRGMKYRLPKKNLNMLGSDIGCIENMELQQLKRENNDRIDANSATSDANSATSGANSATSDGTPLLKKRMKKEELQTLMLNICQDWVSLEEVVIKANRSSSYIRNIVIPRMLEMKLLEMLYPGTPNHPNQKYKVKD